uniref:transposase n=1 Tax=Candidatus Mycobacterium methanotrophicum TaxID=2943498 RepID=UPI001C59C1CB|nr:transposase [Candidatus Mycobacterium methanotrophicum]
MRASPLLNALFELPGARVGKAAVEDGELRVTASLCRRQLECPQCRFSARHRYDTREADSSWRHLDTARRICRILLRRRGLRCPDRGVLAEGMPFARPGSRRTRDFEDLAAWLVAKTDRTTASAFARIAWRTVGAICGRVAADVPDPGRLSGLADIGVDEISWRKHRRYFTLVSDHDSATIVWGKPGKDVDTLHAFFDELPDGGASIEAVSMDMGPAYAKAVRERAPAAVICSDPFHVVKLATDGPGAVRRQVRPGRAHAARSAHRQDVQGCSLGVAEKPRRSHRHPGPNPAEDETQRWNPLARLSTRGSAA